MKKIAVIAIIFIIFFPKAVLALDDPDIQNIIDTLDLSALEEQYNSEINTLNPITNGLNLNEFLNQLASGQMFIEYDSIFDFLGEMIKNGIYDSLPFVIEILIITLLFSVLSVFNPGFGASFSSAHYAKYILICGIAIGVFLNTFTLGIESIDRITGFSTEYFPVLFFLLTSIGGIASSSILKPATAALTGFVSVFAKTFISPLLIVLCAVTVLSGFAKTFRLDNMRELIKSVIKWAIGISSVIFLGCIAMQGLVSSTFDGITLKAAKYTIDKAVPIVGGVFSETMDMLIASSLIIKNAVGIVGVLIIIIMLLSPVMTMTVQYFLLKLASAVAEPLGSEDISKFLRSMSDVVLLQNAVLLTSGAMMLINIGLVLGSGNINVMFR